MENKIIVEFDKERIKEWCKLQRIYPSSFCPCYNCKQSEKEQIECMLMEGSLYIDIDYKIKEQNNGHKGTEDKEIKEDYRKERAY